MIKRDVKTISKVDNDWNNEIRNFLTSSLQKIMKLIRERAQSAKEIFEEYPDLYELLNKVNSDEEISFQSMFHGFQNIIKENPSELMIIKKKHLING